MCTLRKVTSTGTDHAAALVGTSNIQPLHADLENTDIQAGSAKTMYPCCGERSKAAQSSDNRKYDDDAWVLNHARRRG